MGRSTGHHYEFGPFRLDAGERVLRRGAAPVRLQEKVLDTLLLLVENHGHIVEKDELMKRVWPDVVVEENNLNKTVSAARKALGEGRGAPRYIETVPKRGYRFMAAVRERGDEEADEEEKKPDDRSSLAVLPFRMLGPSRSDEYLGMGMADALITRLSNVRQVVVRPTSAVLKYQATAADAVAAGRELRVDSVLEGSIRRAAERIRVTVQLVSARDGVPLWAEKFDEDLTDMFAVEDKVSERAARALTRRLSREERELIARRPTESPEAYQLYLKGRYHAAKFTPGGLRKALECLERAVALDPGYALAYVGLAYYYFASCNEFSLPPRVAMPKTKEVAQAALRLDDTLGEAHLYLAGVCFWYEWDWEAAESEFERAVELSPQNAAVHFYYGHALTLMGRFEAGIAACRRAKEIDPVSPETITNLGIAYYFARRGDLALEQLLQAIEIDPGYWFAWLQAGRVHALAGRLPEAIEALRTAWRLEDAFPEVLATLAGVHALAGKKAKARALLADVGRRSRRGYVPAYHVAGALAALDEPDEAFASLEKAFEQRSTFMSWLRTDPALDRLRKDPRFSDLVRRVGLGE